MLIQIIAISELEKTLTTLSLDIQVTSEKMCDFKMNFSIYVFVVVFLLSLLK